MCRRGDCRKRNGRDQAIQEISLVQGPGSLLRIVLVVDNGSRYLRVATELSRLVLADYDPAVRISSPSR